MSADLVENAPLEDVIKIKSVTFSGLIGKDYYKSFYFLEQGNVFTPSTHAKALSHMINALINDGYCNAVAQTLFDYKKEAQTISLVIQVKTGKRHVIRDIVIEPQLNVTDALINPKMIEQSVRALIEPELMATYYSSDLVAEQMRKIKDYCHKLGFEQVAINCSYECMRARMKLVIGIILSDYKECSFIGNKFFSESMLQEKILTANQGGTHMPPLFLVGELKEEYNNNGFLDVTIQHSSDGNRTIFSINEGVRYHIEDIQYSIELSRAEHDMVQALFVPVLRSSYYDLRIIKKSIDAVVSWFFSQGFWDVSINYVLLPGKNIDGRILQCNINKGHQRMIVGVVIQSFDFLKTAEPFKNYSNIICPVPFDLSVIGKQHTFLADYLYKNGFLYSSFTPEYTETPNGIFVTWKLNGPDKPTLCGKTSFIGNIKTPEYVLQREMQHRHGDIFSLNKIQASLDRLKQLQLFDAVALEPDFIGTFQQTKDIVIRIHEDNPIELQARAGVGLQGGNMDILGGFLYRLGASINIKNFFHQGDIVSLNADIGRYIQEGFVQTIFAGIGNIPVRNSVKLYISKIAHELGQLQDFYHTLQTGVSWSLSRSYNHSTWQLINGFEWLQYASLSENRSKDLMFDLPSDTCPYFMSESIFSYDKLNDKISPSQGFATNISVKFVVPVLQQLNSFCRLLWDGSFFIPAWKQIIFACHARVGTFINAPFNHIFPHQRFYLGGPSSVRGYEVNSAPPIIHDSKNSCNNIMPIGGKSMANINFELQFPFYKKWWGAVFTDVGILSQFTCPTGNDSFIGASGFGIKYDTSMGSLRLDIGWKWKKRFPEDCPYSWFLTFGHAF